MAGKHRIMEKAVSDRRVPCAVRTPLESVLLGPLEEEGLMNCISARQHGSAELLNRISDQEFLDVTDDRPSTM